jgi:hypothetical protein
VQLCILQTFITFINHTHTHSCNNTHTHYCNNTHTHYCNNTHTHYCNNTRTHSCTERCTNEVMSVGINSVREILVRVPALLREPDMGDFIEGTHHQRVLISPALPYPTASCCVPYRISTDEYPIWSMLLKLACALTYRDSWILTLSTCFTTPYAYQIWRSTVAKHTRVWWQQRTVSWIL